MGASFSSLRNRYMRSVIPCPQSYHPIKHALLVISGCKIDFIPFFPVYNFAL